MMDLIRRILFLPTGASSIAFGVDSLHAFVLGVTMFMSTYVFLAAAWFTIRYARRREGQLTVKLSASRRHEAFVIGGVAFTFLLWWVIGFRQYATMTSPPKDAEIIYVDAKQWMWKFAYPDGRSANDTLTVPLGRPVKLVMTSRDVIHSFYVPAFRLKQDLVPGRTTTLWFEATEPGTFPIWCAEYCGVSHSMMRGQVVVLPQDAYSEWARQGRSISPSADCGHGPGSCRQDDWADRGREVATKRACVACHTFDGQRHIGPTWRGLYGSEVVLADGRHVVADDAYLTRSMMEPNVEVVAGFPQVMPSYQATLTAEEAGALVEFIKSLRDTSAQAPGVGLPALDVTPQTTETTPPTRESSK